MILKHFGVYSLDLYPKENQDPVIQNGMVLSDPFETWWKV